MVRFPIQAYKKIISELDCPEFERYDALMEDKLEINVGVPIMETIKYALYMKDMEFSDIDKVTILKQ